ncbi:hypothetical protein SDJN03_22081, partial [Cucurbita argyrosperma subsp. sororia]
MPPISLRKKKALISSVVKFVKGNSVFQKSRTSVYWPSGFASERRQPSENNRSRDLNGGELSRAYKQCLARKYHPDSPRRPVIGSTSITREFIQGSGRQYETLSDPRNGSDKWGEEPLAGSAIRLEDKKHEQRFQEQACRGELECADKGTSLTTTKTTCNLVSSLALKLFNLPAHS